MATVKKAVKKPASAKSTTQKQSYAAIENAQLGDPDGVRFYLFHAPASAIYQWGLIDRMSPDNPKAIQRRLNRTKILRIKEFLSYSGNTIATSVVVVFDERKVSFDGEANGIGNLSVSWRPGQAAGIIVDGQHRVIGAHEYKEDISLNVVGIIGADDTEGAFQFLVINNNSSKVSPSQVKALFTSYKEEELLQRMLDSGSTNVDAEKITALDLFDGGSDSPFKGQLKWAKNANGFVVANALESGLSEVQNRSALLSVTDLEIDTFVGIWAVLKEQWNDLWNRDSHLLEKASVQALTAYICDALEKLLVYAEEDVDYSDPAVLAQGVKQVLKRLEPAFFQVQWAVTGLDTRAGHELLMSDLRQVASNVKAKRQWYSNLETVNIGAVSGGQVEKSARPRKVKK